MDYTEARAKFEALMTANGMEFQYRFIPFSNSRNKAEKNRSLNWSATLMYKGNPVVTVNYSAGIAHCPSFGNGRMTVDVQKAINRECETGFRATATDSKGNLYTIFNPKNPIIPDHIDVLSSLLMDADAIDYAGFEDWAPDMGYDPDSRAAEAIYRECLTVALALRAKLPHSVFSELRELTTYM